VRFLFFLALFLFFPVVAAQGSVSVDRWQASVSYKIPDAVVELDLSIANGFEEKVVGLKMPFSASALDLIESDEEFSKKNVKEISISEESGLPYVKVSLIDPVDPGAKGIVRFRFKAMGLLSRTDTGYSTSVKFGKPEAILEGGKNVELGSVGGIVRLHVPVGYIPSGYKPTPWRELWQGVSGFEDHFVAIFDGISFTQEIKAEFEIEPLLKDIINYDGEIEKLVYRVNVKEKAGENVGEISSHIDTAKSSLNSAIDDLLAGNKKDAKVKIEEAGRHISLAEASLGMQSEIQMVAPTEQPVAVSEGGLPVGVIGLIVASIVVIAAVGGLILRKL
jgi:hypothetical protein